MYYGIRIGPPEWRVWGWRPVPAAYIARIGEWVHATIDGGAKKQVIVESEAAGLEVIAKYCPAAWSYTVEPLPPDEQAACAVDFGERSLVKP